MYQRKRALAIILVGGLLCTMLPRPSLPDSGAGPPQLPKPLTLPAQPIVPGTAVGYMPAAWDVSSSGTFTEVLPVEVPPGRNGMQPALSITYTSSMTNG